MNPCTGAESGDTRPMYKKLAAFMAIGCVLLLTGCLEFESQTLTYRYDAKTDTLRIFQVYQGIFGEDRPDELSDKELGQLQSVLSGQRTFFFANWIWEYDRDAVRKGLEDLGKPEAPQDAKLEPAARAQREAFFNLLLDNVQVENGAFYLDGQGKLCGTQLVTVSRFSKLIVAGNAQIRQLLKSEAGREKISAQERALFLKSARRQRAYIALEGNQLRFRLPIARAEFDKSYGPDSSSAKQLESFKRQGGSVAFADNEMKWSLGAPGAQAVNLTLPGTEKAYVPNAVDAVKKRAAVLVSLDAAAAAQAFVSGSKVEGRQQNP